MLKLFKNLKPYTVMIVFIILLVGGQAYAQLSLPDMMSRIINNGIYYDYNALEPYQAARDENGNVEYLIQSDYMSIPRPATDETGASIPIDESHPDYKLFLDSETGRPLQGFKVAPYEVERDADGAPVYVQIPQLNADGTPVLGDGGLPVLIQTNVPMPADPENIRKIDPSQSDFADYIEDFKLFFSEDGTSLKPDTVFFAAMAMAGVTIDESSMASLMTMDYKYTDDFQLIAQADIPYILKTGGLMLLFTLGVCAAAVIVSYLSSKVTMGFGRILRSKIFRKAESFSLKEFDQFGNASLNTRTTNDVTQIQNVLVMLLRILVMAPIMFIGGLVMSLSKSAEMTLVLVFTIPVILILILLVLKFGSPIFKSMQKKIDRLTLVLRENLTGIRVIRAFNCQQKESERFEQANADYTKAAIKANRIMAVMMPTVQFVMQMTTLAITFITAYRAGTTANANVGNMMAVIQYVMQIMSAFIMLAMIFVMLPRASASAQRINEVLETEPTVHNPAGGAVSSALKGQLEFRNVSYSFSDSADAPVLKDISFKASPGETVAVIGSTGSGKSTLLNLIPRFFDATAGEVLVDGVNVKDMDLDVLRKKIGFVPQKAVLFTGTIAENIRYGDESADMDRVIHAAKIAQADDFIRQSEHGYDTNVSQSGKNFSGGQKQRLSIARALCRDAEIYVFDDSFSALDFKTDAALRAALKEEVKDATVLIVAQRIGTVLNADRILVLDEGKLVGVGTHKELLDTCPVYREIALSQLSEEELENGKAD